MMNNQMIDDYNRIERAINYLDQNYHHQPELKEIAEKIYLSEFHFQRLFSRWVGISPKRFLQFLTKEHAKTLLAQSKSVLDTAYDTGLSSPSRLHDLFIQCEALTPGEFKNGGADIEILYGVHPTRFGNCLIAQTEKGICGLQFLKGNDKRVAIKLLRKKFPRATFREDVKETSKIVVRIFSDTGKRSATPMTILLKGTNFQIKVWEALLRIPQGSVVSYQDIASHLGVPNAVRAVANAVAHNAIQYVIPCHRVIRNMGAFGGYQGGTARKIAILGWESALSERFGSQKN
ncbi:MAG: methylated-DNA--[protein]-cysteine S-methyltransferase [Bacteroidota bacterium]